MLHMLFWIWRGRRMRQARVQSHLPSVMHNLMAATQEKLPPMQAISQAKFLSKSQLREPSLQSFICFILYVFFYQNILWFLYPIKYYSKTKVEIRKYIRWKSLFDFSLNMRITIRVPNSRWFSIVVWVFYWFSGIGAEGHFLLEVLEKW